MAIITGNTDNRADIEDRYRQYAEEFGVVKGGGEFSKLLETGADSFQPQYPANMPATGLEPNNQDLFGDSNTPQHLSSHGGQAGHQPQRGRGVEGGDETGDGLREEANDLRARANDLRNQADEVEAENPELAQTLRNRAIALDQRADAVDERADIAVERRRIAEEDRMLNGGNGDENGLGGSDVEFDDSYDTVIVGDGDLPSESEETSPEWIDERVLAMFAIALEDGLSDVAEFGGDIEVSASREANESEVEAFLDRAEINGATTEDLELIEGYADAFPIQFVFVDNLISDYGMESAAGGPITVEGTSTILLDSSFIDNDFTVVSPFDDPAVSEQGVAAVEFAYDSILEIFDLPGQTTTGSGDTGATTATVTSLGENDDAAIVATPVMSTTSAVPTVESTDDDDEENAGANAAVSGAGDFDADE